MSGAQEAMGAVGSNRLTVLAADVRAAHKGVLDAAKTAAERAIDAGRALIEAKDLLEHGQWLPWLKEHCELSERTAQLYMQIAGLGLEPEVLAAMGLKAAAKAVVVHDHSYDPFCHCADKDRRQWHLFIAFGISWRHVEWLLNKQFVNPDEWLGPEGARWRRAWRMREIPESFNRAWAAFQQEQATTPMAEAMTMAEAMERRRAEEAPTPRRRRRRNRKSAPVADLEKAA
jgi:hypothetical protein